MHPAIYKDENSVEFLKAVQKARSSRFRQMLLAKECQEPMNGQGNAVMARGIRESHNIDPYLMLSNEVLKWAAKHGNSAVVPEEISDQVKQWQRNLIWPSFAEKFRLPELSS